MVTKIIEVTNVDGGGINWGKFMVCKFDAAEWALKSQVEPISRCFLHSLGWGKSHVIVFDLQTGEGATFLAGGSASADLNRHKIWVCPMFEPFLAWLYEQDLSDIIVLPSLLKFTEKEAPSSLAGYRRPGEIKEAVNDRPPKSESKTLEAISTSAQCLPADADRAGATWSRATP